LRNDRFKVNLKSFYNQIHPCFNCLDSYSVENSFAAEQQQIYAGNAKLNANYKFDESTEAQFTAIYLAPDSIPQGSLDSRFSLDVGLKKSIQQGKGELFLLPRISQFSVWNRI
jgi:hypothetical protein